MYVHASIVGMRLHHVMAQFLRVADTVQGKFNFSLDHCAVQRYFLQVYKANMNSRAHFSS